MLRETAIQDVRRRIRGSVLTPNDAGYDEGRRVFNAMVDRRPAVIVRCAAKEDVVAAAEFAREHALAVSIKGGGHSVAGNAVCDDGVMIDCSGMKGIEIDPARRTARARPGLTLGEFDQATTAKGLFTTMGVVSKTGIAGLTLGGGLGWLMGKFGLACDNLIGAEVVTAEGKMVRASEQENSDLLWGLRGGGGNFGIVSEFEYRLHPVEPVIGGLVLHPADCAKDLLHRYIELTAKCPDELTLYLAMQNAPDGTPVCGFGACYCGDPAAGENALGPVHGFGAPVADMIAPVPYVQQQRMIDDAYPSGWYHYWKASMMDRIDGAAIDVLVDYFRRRPSPFTQMFFEHLHGAACRVPATATAFGHRAEQFNFSVFGIWQKPEETEANMTWMRQLWNDFQPYRARRTYVNYLSEEGEERVREAYGANYERLVALKQKYDPSNFFRLNQNIAPKAEAAANK